VLTLAGSRVPAPAHSLWGAQTLLWRTAWGSPGCTSTFTTLQPSLGEGSCHGLSLWGCSRQSLLCSTSSSSIRHKLWYSSWYIMPYALGCSSLRRSFHKVQTHCPACRDLLCERLKRFLPAVSSQHPSTSQCF